MAYEELKQKHSVVWGNGPYQNITDTLTDIHDRVIERLAPGPGVAYLDLACGTGAGADRHRPRARGRAGAGHRLPRGRLRAPGAGGRELRRRLLDAGDHVRAR